MEILILVILVLINGFFALSEIALVSSKKSKLEHIARKGNNGAKIALQLLDDSENFLSAIQVGITLIGIVTGVYGGISIADDIAPFFIQFEFTSFYSNEIALSLTVIAITYVSIVIGELVPKTIALSMPEKTAIIVAPFIYYISKIFYPFVVILSLSTNLINGIIGIKKQLDILTEAELLQLMLTAKNEGLIEKDQHLIHQKLFHFADKKAKHIMTHRTDVDWINVNLPNERIKNEILNSKHSKIIGCNNNIDNYLGILDTKIYFKAIIQNKEVKIGDLIIKPIIVPEDANAQYILNLFRHNQTYICIVVNEFGGFEGIITLHDILENIIGELPDEGDSNDPDIFVRDDKSFLVSGDAPVEILLDIIDDFNLDFQDIDYSTVAGFVLEKIKKIPNVGDKIDFLGYTIEIVDVDVNRIDKLLIRKISND